MLKSSFEVSHTPATPTTHSPLAKKTKLDLEVPSRDLFYYIGFDFDEAMTCQGSPQLNPPSFSMHAPLVCMGNSYIRN